MAEGESGRSVSGRRKFESEVIALMPQLKGFSRSLAKNPTDADDLVQDTIVKALSKWELFEAGTNLKNWLFTIMRNDLYEKKRRSWRNVWLDPEVAESMISDSNDVANQEEVLQELSAIAPVIATLPHDRRDAFVAVAYAGMSYEEAAAVIGCPVGTIKSMVSRTRDLLTEALATGRKYEYDLQAWATATKKVPQNHPYYPIAKAYEEIYVFVREASNQVHETKPSATQSPLDELWIELQENGGLEDEEDLDRMMRK